MDETINALFARYKESGDVRIRNEIAEKYLYIAEILAKRFVGRGVPYDDLYQEASCALLRAVELYDPSQGASFSTYATSRITGVIKNYFRDNSRLVKPSRKLNELHRAVKKFCNEYVLEKGAQPKVVEIAKALNIDEETVIKALEIGATLSLDQEAEQGEKGGARSLLDTLPVGEDDFEKVEMRETIREIIKGLSEPERKLVIEYRYFDNLSQMETANRMGVSQMFVSRSERKLMQLLKKRLQEEG